mmetsp:Transcript_26892/g.55054  ORF Transcript_26892/g.55054 Transcript_26892/m.55054 type:complete len:90 (-) Transcript_26892:369-638(-)|eukprot:CAMPEP_0183308326 /NCGR_PEP_ID=MMETSP0160_2-20130417/21328_1 /TAXON_ID=2839 ORGANISM="Odontella Sinensis, Strain Grunow 1884" /NCGR_SAMPLE_ID=MMETSP0160_2 /ASSEMBLY_ACC=CAM_ASM_000250 /LENGTH=89 /DNA_ID=CAMNT_0025472147 /DNA_START=42 /DNA_END=311 /DNA_ORIENTATION=-
MPSISSNSVMKSRPQGNNSPLRREFISGNEGSSRGQSFTCLTSLVHYHKHTNHEDDINDMNVTMKKTLKVHLSANSWGYFVDSVDYDGV